MASETIVAVFDTPSRARAAMDEVRNLGVPDHAIRDFAEGAGEARSAEPTRRMGDGDTFWSWLTRGGEQRSASQHEVYDESIASGHIVVTVIADAARANDVTYALDRHQPLEVGTEERGAEFGTAGAGAFDDRVPTSTGFASPGTAAAPTTTGTTRDVDTGPERREPVATGRATGTEQVLPLSEENLEIGKRAVERGTTRVRRYTVERPVEEQIRLRDEHVSVTRRPVTGASARPGEDAFSEKVIEVTETGEEAVVGKTAHVVEEVVISKTAEDRSETVRDTVRREDVSVEGGHASPAVRRDQP